MPSFMYHEEAGRPWNETLSPNCYSVIKGKAKRFTRRDIADINTRLLKHIHCGWVVDTSRRGVAVVRYDLEPYIPEKFRFGGKSTYDHLSDACLDAGMSMDDTREHLQTLYDLTDGYQQMDTLEEQIAYKEHICKQYAKNPIKPRLREKIFTLSKMDVVNLCKDHLPAKVWNILYHSRDVKNEFGTPPLLVAISTISKKITMGEPTPKYKKVMIPDQVREIVNDFVQNFVDKLKDSLSLDKFSPVEVDVKQLEGMTPETVKWLTEVSSIKPAEAISVMSLEPEPELNPDDICSICYEGYTEERGVLNKLRCEHTYHMLCILDWALTDSEQHHTCPMCRTDMK